MELESMKLFNNSNMGGVQISAPEIEETVIAELLVDSDAINRVAPMLKPALFVDARFKLLYNEIAEMHRSGKTIDMVMLVQQLRDKGALDHVGGPGYLQSLLFNVVSSTRINDHINILTDKYSLRRIAEVSSEINSLAKSATTLHEIGDEWEKLNAEINRLISHGESPTTTRQVLTETLKEIEDENLLLQSGIRPGVPIGIYKLDARLGNLRSGTMTIIGARTGVGKTSLALFIARNAALQGKRIVFACFEQRKTDLMRTMLAAVGNIDRIKLRDADVDEADWALLHKATGKIEKMNIGWLDNPALTAPQLAAIVKNEKRNRGCDLLIVDYVQLITNHAKVFSRELEVSGISKTLKNLALSENFAVLALSQLNREADQGEPQLKHLRESGSIEQDADNVLLLWKPDPDQNMIIINIAKNRRGQVGATDIFHDAQMLHFGTDNRFDETYTHPTPENNNTPF